MAITLRNTKGSALTFTELDTNFSDLDSLKAPKASPTFTGNVTFGAGSHAAFWSGTQDGVRFGGIASQTTTRVHIGSQTDGAGAVFEYERGTGNARLGQLGTLAGTTTGVIEWTANRNVTINAPTSGVALTVTGASGEEPFRATGSGGYFAISSIGGLAVNATASTYVALSIQNGGGVNTQLDSNSGTEGALRTVSNHPLKFYSNNTSRFEIGAAGNVTINAPTSGVALTVTGTSGTAIAQDVVGQLNITTTAGVQRSRLQWDASNGLRLYNVDNTPLKLGTADTSRVEVSATGAVTVNAPTSGTGLTVAGGGAAITGTFAAGSSGTQWSIDSSNRLINPGNTQPFVLATTSSTLNTGSTLIFGNEVTDQGGNYNNTTGVFTAPIAGIYEFTVGMRFNNNSGSNQIGSVTATFSTAGSLAISRVIIPTSQEWMASGTIQIRLNASETATFTSFTTFSAGQFEGTGGYLNARLIG